MLHLWHIPRAFSKRFLQPDVCDIDRSGIGDHFYPGADSAEIQLVATVLQEPAHLPSRFGTCSLAVPNLISHRIKYLQMQVVREERQASVVLPADAHPSCIRSQTLFP